MGPLFEMIGAPWPGDARIFLQVRAFVTLTKQNNIETYLKVLYYIQQYFENKIGSFPDVITYYMFSFKRIT